MSFGPKALIVPTETILPLRWRVLRPNAPSPDEARFPEDEIFPNWHIGIFPGSLLVPRNDQLMCCATFVLTSAGTIVAWQLRGMATAPEQRGRGLGRILLSQAEEYILSLSRVAPVILWCNARIEAVGFYEKLGWKKEGIEFIIKGIGRHYRMTRRLR